MARVLAIPDLHGPYTHPGALSFCKDLREKHKCDTIVLLGDVPDFTALSRFPKQPEAPSSQDEYKAFLKWVKPWYKAFPKTKVCYGNHEARFDKRAAEVGIPKAFLKSLNQVMETPGWKWDDKWIIDDVMYTHGLGAGGKYHSANLMDKLLCSVVVGHIHTVSMLYWKANYARRIFGMNCGCLVDDTAVAFAYSKTTIAKSILSAGVILDGIPSLHILPCGRGEKYHKSRF